MRRNEAIAWFVGLATLAAGGCFAIHGFLASAGATGVGYCIDAVVLGLIGLAAAGCFLPNAPIFGRVVDGTGVAARVMALTFDDGPSAETTPRILDTLRAANARATFFVLGRHAERHPELVRRMVDEGHEVASHGWGHGILVFSRPAAIHSELDRTADVLRRCGAPTPRHFRAPHGFRGPLLVRTVARQGYRVVGWSKGVFDTARPGPSVIAERSRQAMHPGAVLLLHDADGNGSGDRSQTADALPAILEGMHERGLRPVTIAELANLRPARTRSWWRLLAAGALIAAVIGVIAYEADISFVRDSAMALLRLDPRLLAAAVLANLVSVVLKATVWKACLESVPGRPPVRYQQVISAIFVGFLLNSVLVARAGDVGRAVVLHRRIARDAGVRVPLSTLAGTVVMETLVLGLTLAMLLLVAVFAVPGMPSSAVRATEILLVMMVLLGVASVAAEWFMRRMQVAGRIGNAPRRGGLWWKVRQRALHALHGLALGQQLRREPRLATIALAAGVLSWVANLVAIYFALLAFEFHGSALAAAVVVFAVSNVVGMVPLTPGNVGIFQLAIALALAQGFGVDQAFGIRFGIGLQAIEVGLGAGLGFVFLSLEGLSFAEVRHELVEERPDVDAAAAAVAIGD